MHYYNAGANGKFSGGADIGSLQSVKKGNDIKNPSFVLVLLLFLKKIHLPSPATSLFARLSHCVQLWQREKEPLTPPTSVVPASSITSLKVCNESSKSASFCKVCE